jgi:hypothetical protein
MLGILRAVPLLLQGNMSVRYMDWNDDLQRLSRHDAAAAVSGGVRGASPERYEGQELPPALRAREAFDVVLGSDILYEVLVLDDLYSTYHMACPSQLLAEP